MYKKAEACFWTVEEIDLSADLKDWNSLNDKERNFNKTVLAFFVSSDAIVNENLVMNFACEVSLPEARCFYGFQIAMENIHTETYSLLLDTFISDKQERNELCASIQTIPCVKAKADWALKWCNRTYASFAERLVAFAVVEGVFFSASFCAIFWLKKRGMMPGLSFSNLLISRDEGLHCDFACILYSKLEQKISNKRISEIVSSAVEVEVEFVNDALPEGLLGMNQALMCEYVKFCADRLLYALKCPKYYNAQNPFEWMETISLQGKANFHERRVGEYSLANIGVDKEERIFTLDADF